MNERIDEIAFEAGCHRHKYWDPKHPDLEGFIISQATLDKFAELIVRECADRLMQDVFASTKGIMRIAGARLKEHFGVEE